MEDVHVQGPRREEERVPARRRALLRERLEVEELTDGHAPEPVRHVSGLQTRQR